MDSVVLLESKDGKYFIGCGGERRREVSRDVMVELYQVILVHLSPGRDYSSISNMSKLARAIDFECEPDDDADPSPETAPEPTPAPTPAPAKAAAKKPGPGAKQKKQEDE